VSELGRFEESSSYNKKALSIQVEAYGEKNWLVPSIYANMAWDYYELDSLDKSMEYLEKAILIREELSGLKDPDLAIDYTRYGKLLAKKGEIDQGLKYLHKGLAVNYFGEVDLSSPGTIDPAKLKDGNLFIEILATLISYNKEYLSFPTVEELHKHNLVIYELIADLSIKLRESYRFEKSRLYALQQWNYLYADGFETAAALYEITGNEIYFSKAFRFAGLKKASALTDAILASQAMKNSGIPEKQVLQEESLRTTLEGLRQSLLELEGDSARLFESEQINSQINQTAIELNSLLLTLEKEYPDYNSLRSRYPDYSPEDITRLMDPGSLLLDFVVSDSAIHAIIIGKNGHWIEHLKVPANFEVRIYDLLQALKKYQIHNYLSLSHEISQALIHPLEKYFEGIERIITIPESYLLLLPLDVLICEEAGKGLSDLSELDFFIKRFETLSHYSTDLWVRSKQKSMTNNEAPGKKTFLGMAPVFDTLIIRSDGIARDSDSLIYAERKVVDRMSLKGLPYSRHEVEKLAAMFAEEGDRSEALLMEHATEANFRELSGSFKYIHIATHGLMNPEKPELSGLVFWKDTSTQTKDVPQLLIAEKNDDGVLYTKEMYKLDLNADLVTLSACETGAGKLVKGEGLLSFVRGLTFAGVPNVLISYWKVNDKTTAKFMFDFYGEVLSGESYSRALRTAKLLAIEDPSTAFPATWGTFVLIGH
ncbi:MAG: CHAT domain-containing protein, partial [Bacteroidetes bacterium]|nr:CHAT domain-containing protein [Bacteroidota bacterium]